MRSLMLVLLALLAIDTTAAIALFVLVQVAKARQEEKVASLLARLDDLIAMQGEWTA